MDALRTWAERQPDRMAAVFPQTGEALSFAQLDAAATQAAHWLIGRGLAAGDAVALLLENRPEMLRMFWAARRAGLYYVPVSTYLAASEIGHILRDSEARLLVAHRALAGSVPPGIVDTVLVDPGGPYQDEIGAYPADRPLPSRPGGRSFMYSSGTTGVPKGVRFPLPLPDGRDTMLPTERSFARLLDGGPGDTYLSAAPLYHAAPHLGVMVSLSLGMSTVVLRRFDAATILADVARFGVTHSQWVPTMFARLLALPADMRSGHDLSRHRRALHAASPCPVHVKERMIEWWGPILIEYYSGTESIGRTSIESHEWLTHKGSVGRAVLGELHITDDVGRELPAGEVGTVYFAGAANFRFHNDAEKTAAAYNDRGWATYGDIGWMDAEGYLYLTDRRRDLIITGGVNVYPQEVENTLLRHPAISDAAVIGLPDDDYGETVKAVVELRTDGQVSAAELMAFCREHLAGPKRPRSIDIVDALPRTETGKMLRRIVRESYYGATSKLGKEK